MKTIHYKRGAGHFHQPLGSAPCQRVEYPYFMQTGEGAAQNQPSAFEYHTHSRLINARLLRILHEYSGLLESMNLNIRCHG